MDLTSVTLDRRFAVGAVSPFIYGGFLEHMGRSIYQGVYDPESAHADEDGFRTDVLGALSELAMTIVRYPGGNFASGYRWRDGIGARESRPTVRELAWQSIETNEFGTDEFIRLCRKLDWTPMLTVNLGTGSPEEARDWVEYCNAPTGTLFADMRAAGGSEAPHAVPIWCLGNEMDGPWQLGHAPAGEYALRARQAARMMKACDRSIETVACGSSGPRMPTWLEWDRTVLESMRGAADHVSLHRYVGNPDGDSPGYLAIGHGIDRQIEAVNACCQYVQARAGSRRRAFLCFDEWNVWYRARGAGDTDGGGKFAPRLIEERYNLEDALAVGAFLMSFIRHADCVKIANLAQLVNVIGPLLTDGDELLKQSIFYAFKLFSDRKGGTALSAYIDGPLYETEYGAVPYLDAAATIGDNSLNLFAMNRHLSEPLPLVVEFGTGEIARVESSEMVHASSLDAENTFEAPNTVVSKPFEGWSTRDQVVVELPPHSLVATTFQLA
ncbi:MAG: alpha-N-arabinofuranosidase [Gammaproteobacteria bacterium]|nr:alpha-N-arabinofuranosidase [Gammaproteobacteria bacterium]